MEKESIFKVGMRVVEHDIYGFPIKEKGRLRIRTIIEDSIRTAAILNYQDVAKVYSTLEYVSLSICNAHFRSFIPFDDYHKIAKL